MYGFHKPKKALGVMPTSQWLVLITQELPFNYIRDGSPWTICRAVAYPLSVRAVMSVSVWECLVNSLQEHVIYVVSYLGAGKRWCALSLSLPSFLDPSIPLSASSWLTFWMGSYIAQGIIVLSLSMIEWRPVPGWPRHTANRIWSLFTERA